MKKKFSSSEAFKELRKTAERLLKEEQGKTKLEIEDSDLIRLTHELEVSNIELELQNQELRRAKAEIEASREEYLDLYNTSPVAYMTISEKGIIEKMNLAAQHLINPKFSGLPFINLLYSNDLSIYQSFMMKLAVHRKAGPVELRLRSKDDSVYVHLEGVAKVDAKQRKQFRLAMVDISERKRVEEELKRLNETLEQQVAERTDLAKTRARQLQALAVELLEAEEHERHRIAELLHDDFQQMLAAALFQLQAAKTSLQNEPMFEAVKEILVESIEKSRKLSHELSPPILYHGSLNIALEWLGCQMNDQFGLKVELQDEKAPYLENKTLKVFLFRAVQELLFNVVKHAGVKSAHVAISGSDGNFMVTVSDQGKGFNKDIIDSFREKTGFGLISIRERAQHIGGYLKIKSEPGQGSTLILVTPVQTANRQESLTTGEPIDSAEQETVCVGTELRVLFVDDHKVMRQGLIRLISSKPGIQVVGEAANGKEAVELARQLHPDVIVMDISMPEMDGVEATRRIKSEFPALRIVGLSMFEEDQSVKSIINAGADAFVPKTASSAKLLKAIYGNQE